MTAPIRIDDADGVRVVTWERAEALNAMSVDMWDATRDALDSATTDEIRCIVLTGSGRAFNVGQDLGEMADPRQADDTRGYRGVMRALAGRARSTDRRGERARGRASGSRCCPGATSSSSPRRRACAFRSSRSG